MWWLALAQMGYGIYQTIKADKEKSKLHDYQNYKDSKEIMAEAKNQARGYTAKEKLAFFQQMAQNNARKYYQAMSYRPDMANTIMAGINYGNIGAINEFAAKDAQLRRQDEQRLAGLIQTQDARNVSAFNSRLQMREQALGQAKQAGVQNIWGGATSAMNNYRQDTQFNQYMDYLNNTGGKTSGGAGGNTSGTPASGISDGTSMKIPSDKQYFSADFKRSSAEKNMSTFPFTSYEETDYDNPYYYNINSFFRSTR